MALVAFAATMVPSAGVVAAAAGATPKAPAVRVARLPAARPVIRRVRNREEAVGVRMPTIRRAGGRRPGTRAGAARLPLPGTCPAKGGSARVLGVSALVGLNERGTSCVPA